MQGCSFFIYAKTHAFNNNLGFGMHHMKIIPFLMIPASDCLQLMLKPAVMTSVKVVL